MLLFLNQTAKTRYNNVCLRRASMSRRVVTVRHCSAFTVVGRGVLVQWTGGYSTHIVLSRIHYAWANAVCRSRAHVHIFIATFTHTHTHTAHTHMQPRDERRPTMLRAARLRIGRTKITIQKARETGTRTQNMRFRCSHT